MQTRGGGGPKSRKLCRRHLSMAPNLCARVPPTAASALASNYGKLPSRRQHSNSEETILGWCLQSESDWWAVFLSNWGNFIKKQKILEASRLLHLPVLLLCHAPSTITIEACELWANSGAVAAAKVCRNPSAKHCLSPLRLSTPDPTHTCSCHGTQLLPYIRGVTVLPGSKFSK